MPLHDGVSPGEVFSVAEIARAASVDPGVAERLIARGTFRDRAGYVGLPDAVRAVRRLREVEHGGFSGAAPRHLFAPLTSSRRPRALPLAASGTVHVGLFAALALAASLGLTRNAADAQKPAQAAVPVRMVFLATPGPGGGGGGGGLRQPSPPPRAERKGSRRLSSPLPRRVPPRPVVAVERPAPPRPPVLAAEPLPPITAPIVAAPADMRDRTGVLAETAQAEPSHGPGTGGGTGTGEGTGLGEGSGDGVGRGSGGGTGGGPYRPGSGIEPPRLLHEVKPDYTEDARRRSIEGEVVLEIVVRRDGGVGDIRLVRGLGSGLDRRAIDAVRQWRFAPASRLGSPVDVLVEVAVEFRLR
jgi:TonB family protein